LLQEFDGTTQLLEMQVTEASYLIQLHNLPLNGMTAEVVEFGASQGKSEEINVLEDKIGWGSG